jgi:dienelactone hydrolase
MHTQDIEYRADGARLVGQYVVDDSKPGKRPGVLVCIGADDPIIPPEQRADFEKEMKAAGVDWRLQLYGGAGHSFTNPAADSRGMTGFFYHEATDRRSWNAMIELFNETLK